MAETSQEKPLDQRQNEQLKFAREAIADEVKYRRDRRSSIFSWASSLLVGVSGGVVALTYSAGKQLGYWQQSILTVAVFVLTGHAVT